MMRRQPKLRCSSEAEAAALVKPEVTPLSEDHPLLLIVCGLDLKIGSLRTNVCCCLRTSPTTCPTASNGSPAWSLLALQIFIVLLAIITGLAALYLREIHCAIACCRKICGVEFRLSTMLI
jgi:hypothetical protein